MSQMGPYFAMWFVQASSTESSSYVPHTCRGDFLGVHAHAGMDTLQAIHQVTPGASMARQHMMEWKKAMLWKNRKLEGSSREALVRMLAEVSRCENYKLW